MEPTTLAAAWTAVLPDARVDVVDDPAAALALALDRDPALGRASGSPPLPGGPVVVAGSLYLVGAVRARLVLDPDLVDPPGTTR